MAQTCPTCSSELAKPEKQRFCGSCGEPINVEVDRERIRRETDGFLDASERSRIADTVAGDGGVHHEYTHVHVQEEVRHALRDFWLITEWEEFDNREALLGDLERHDPGELEEEDEVAEMRSLLSLLRLLHTSLSMSAIERFLELDIRRDMAKHKDLDFKEVPELNLEIRINGEPASDLEEKSKVE